jgi:hypothetical protein
VKPAVLSALALAMLLAGCAAGGFSRNLYEGARARDDSLRGTPREVSRPPLPVFDQYDRERRALARPRDT